MIKRTITTPAIPGLEIDNTHHDVVISVDDINEYEGYGFGWEAQHVSPLYRFTLVLPTGAKIVLEPDVVGKFECAYQLTETVELEEGKLYLLADRRKPNDKWVALCRKDRACKWKRGKEPLVLVPIDNEQTPERRTVVFARDKDDFIFYEEFDLHLKEYL